MDITQKVAVVTGGASGIGKAICQALAAGGAAGVVVADLDAEGAAQVAKAIEADGHRAISAPTDVSRAADVQALVDRARAEYGRIDLFISNAGIIAGGGLEVPDPAWDRSWAVNVHAHVHVARAVIPEMIERGSGYLVITASAAGLLTELDSAPYAVTKHAAVALAEWLSITYGDQGLTVSCLCPQAVRTNLGATSRKQTGGEPPELGSQGSAGWQAAVDGVLAADQVAAAVLAGLADERFLILPHPEVATYEQRRAGDRDRWLRGMRRFRTRLLAGPRR
jgi:NAD(P)-dependent dehydrogenase (short-subunit alcohol dehydrogenase family)